MRRIFWGDIHNHNEIGYAEGTMERSFRLARNTLDFYAFTPHGWWTDVPTNDTGIRRHHEAGFAKVKARWDEVREKIAAENTPGEFVTLPGWEWHSLRWGDYCVYFPDDQAELHYAGDLDELKQLARRTGAIMIPHHPAYALGWRGLDWESLEPDVSPVVEIFSEHGNSLEATSAVGMYSHSMGGTDRNQTGLVQLRRGKRFGLLASGDDHFGYPGAYGQGLTAVLADELTREGMFKAIRARHTYAVTGDRIAIDFHVNDAIPGDTLGGARGNSSSVAGSGSGTSGRPGPAAKPGPREVSLRADIAARDRIRFVEILKNGNHWKRFGPEALTAVDDDAHLLRVEWGWDLLSSELVTTWDLTLRVDGSEIADVTPSFCGGAGSVTELNLLEVRDDRSLRATTYTSRKNIRPVNSLSLVWKGPGSAGIHLEVNGRNGDRPFRQSISLTKKELRSNDHYVSAFDLFSSPKLKVHALIPTGERSAEIRTEDEEAKPGDFYLLKVEQENGQMAWCSPIWIGGKDG